MKDKKSIGARIKYYRILRGMTQEELARAVGYNSASSKSTISCIEAGNRDVSQTKLPLYAKALNVSVLDLLGIEKEEQTTPVQSPDDLLAFALYGEIGAVTAEDLEDIRKFADYVKSRRKNG